MSHANKKRFGEFWRWLKNILIYHSNSIHFFITLDIYLTRYKKFEHDVNCIINMHGPKKKKESRRTEAPFHSFQILSILIINFIFKFSKIKSKFFNISHIKPKTNAHQLHYRSKE